MVPVLLAIIANMCWSVLYDVYISVSILLSLTLKKMDPTYRWYNVNPWLMKPWFVRCPKSDPPAIHQRLSITSHDSLMFDTEPLTM